MTINPYDTREPYLWAGDYLLYRGKVVGFIKQSDIQGDLRPWLGVPLFNLRGELVYNMPDPDFQSTNKAGAMLRLQDWLAGLISNGAVALDTFIKSDQLVGRLDLKPRGRLDKSDQKIT